jgi:dihydrofolate reductase
MARGRVIGANDRMPWRLPADLKRFRALTTGHRVVMGRKTFESLGRALPERENVVVTRNALYAAPGCIVAGSFRAALSGLTLPEPVFCIGGGELYAQALPYASEIFLTEIDAEFAGDAWMPVIPPAEFREDARERASDPERGLDYAFVHLTRIAPPRAPGGR